MNSGYNSVCRILKLSIADLLKVDGFKEKTATTLYNGIKESVEQASLGKLMSDLMYLVDSEKRNLM